MRAEDIPQSVVEAGRKAVEATRVYAVSQPGERYLYVEAADEAYDVIAAALAEYERLGYRLIRDDEATVERYRQALERIEAMLHHDRRATARAAAHEAHAALTAAQGGEDQ